MSTSCGDFVPNRSHLADQAQRQAAASAAQVQELFDRFAEEQRLASNETAEMSVDLITAPARDEEQQRLDQRFKELEEERRKFTEAAVRRGKEKAVLEECNPFLALGLVLTSRSRLKVTPAPRNLQRCSEEKVRMA